MYKLSNFYVVYKINDAFSDFYVVRTVINLLIYIVCRRKSPTGLMLYVAIFDGK